MSSCSCSVPKEKGFLVAVLTIVRTHYAFSRKIATGINTFFAFKNIYQLWLFAITFIRAGVAVQGPLVRIYSFILNFVYDFLVFWMIFPL